MQDEGIQAAVKAFILREFLEGEAPDQLDGSTELMNGGILDSLATLKLITFLEQEYDIEFEGDEVDETHFNTIRDIASLVRSKL